MSGRSLARRSGSILTAVVAIALMAIATPSIAAKRESRLATSLMSGVSPFAGHRCHEEDPAVMKEGQELDGTTAQNPTDASNLITIWIQDGAAGISIANSHDSGRTWQQRGLPGWTRCTGNDRFGAAFDPWVSIGVDGIAYATSVVSWDSEPTGMRNYAAQDIAVSTSRDGGDTWGAQTMLTISPDVVSVDTPHVVADPYVPGRAYLSWVSVVGTPGVFLSKTDDGGTTWTDPTIIQTPAESKVLVAPRIVVLPRGGLVATVSEFVPPVAPGVTGGTTLLAIRSDDRGDSWSPPVTVANVEPSPARDPDSGEPVGRGQPFVIASPGADAAGGVWVAWNESTAVDSGSILLSRSADMGQTWGPPRAVETVNSQVLWPNLAVSPDGELGVLFYDFRNDVRGDDELTTDVWLRTSRDGGLSWTRFHAGGPFDLKSSSTVVGGYPHGDYQGIVATRCGFSVAFTMANPYAVDGETDYFFGHTPGAGCSPAS